MIKYSNPDSDPTYIYDVDEVGIMVRCTDGSTHCISQVNGSTCTNPMGSHPTAETFDDYLAEWVQVHDPVAIGVAQWDAALGCYTPKTHLPIEPPLNIACI